MSILNNMFGFKVNMHRLESESGVFVVDANGIVQRFEPSEDNPLVDEETTIASNYTYSTTQTIRTLIVPCGVKGFVEHFMQGIRISERLVFPESLESIGECCFSKCILPSVSIPESLCMIGNYAFGHSHIDTVRLSASLRSPYGRQFKDSYVGTLRMPKEWKNLVFMEDNGTFSVSGVLEENDFGYLKWPSTRVSKLEFC